MRKKETRREREREREREGGREGDLLLEFNISNVNSLFY